ncbi:MAG: DUF2007 domain-containing protein [Spirochaetales bacterium]|nr:DUF2007 domain-containing protein [Spirochaetales bacterium]
MNIVCVYDGPDHFLALSAKEILESEGITVIMPTEHTGGVYPQYSLITGGNRLMVSEADAPRAREILAGFEGNARPLDEPYPLPERTCPWCGSSKYTEIVEQRRGLMGSLFLILGVLIPVRKRYFQCGTCGKEWK